MRYINLYIFFISLLIFAFYYIKTNNFAEKDNLGVDKKDSSLKIDINNKMSENISSNREENITTYKIDNKLFSIEQDAIELFKAFGQIRTLDINLTALANRDFFIYKQIELFDLFNHYKEPLQLIILKDMELNNIEGEVLYKFKNNKYKVSGFKNIQQQKYSEYPKITFLEAEKRVRDFFNIQDNIILSYEQDFFHINSKNFPIARFNSSQGEEYLINMNSGKILPKDFRTLHLEAIKKREEREQKAKLPLYLDTETGEVILEVYSEEDIKQIIQEVEVENQAIRDGLLKLDENLNLIFDKRKR